MCSRKNEQEVVFAKRRISTAYSLVAVIAVLHFLLGFRQKQKGLIPDQNIQKDVKKNTKRTCLDFLFNQISWAYLSVAISTRF